MSLPRNATLALALALILPMPSMAQSRKEASKADKGADAKVKWDGEWTQVADESDKLEAMIDDHLKDQNFLKKQWWKRKLNNACKAWQNLDILYGTGGFSVTPDKESPLDCAPDGTASDWKRSDGEAYKVSLRKDGPRMTLTLQGDGYTLTYVFSMRKDGDTLALQVTYAHKDLNSFSYKLVFKRNG